MVSKQCFHATCLNISCHWGHPITPRTPRLGWINNLQSHEVRADYSGGGVPRISFSERSQTVRPGDKWSGPISMPIADSSEVELGGLMPILDNTTQEYGKDAKLGVLFEVTSLDRPRTNFSGSLDAARFIIK